MRILTPSFTICLFQPESDDERTWLADHCPDAIIDDDGMVCEPRYAEDLAVGIQDAGFQLHDVEGRPFRLAPAD